MILSTAPRTFGFWQFAIPAIGGFFSTLVGSKTQASAQERMLRAQIQAEQVRQAQINELVKEVVPFAAVVVGAFILMRA